MGSDYLARRIMAQHDRPTQVTTGEVMRSWELSGQPYAAVKLQDDDPSSERAMLATSTMEVGTLAVVLLDGSGFAVAVGSLSSGLDSLGGSALPPGGLADDVLAKASDADGDARWVAANFGDGSGGGVKQGRLITEGVESCGPAWPVPTTVGQGYIPANPNRLSLLIQNVSGTDIWVGGSSQVGDPNGDGVGLGVMVRWGASITMNASPAAAIYIWCPYDRAPVSWLAEEV